MSYIGSKPADAVLETDDIADGVVTTSKLADDSVTNPKLFTGSQQNFRNIIINGDMSIAQRGTSATGIGNGDTGYHTLDRWKFFENDSPSYEFTMSQSTDVPSGYGFATSLKMDCTTAEASLAVDDLAFLEHYIEGQNVQYLKKGTANAEYVTASFWVKSTKTGTFIVELVDLDNSRFTNFNYTVNVSDTWEKKTVSFVPDTTGTLDNDNAASLLFRFGLLAGTTFSSGSPSPTTWLANSGNNAKRAANQVNIADNTANNFLITGVQLEAGTTASDFEFLPVDVNENRCLRYCFVVGITPTNGERNRYSNIGTYYTATQFFSGVEFPIVMRATPSFTVVGATPAQAFTTYASNTARTSTAVAKDSSSATTIGYVITTTSATQGDGGLCAWNLGYYGIIDAEL
jgi:hypothetical protein